MASFQKLTEGIKRATVFIFVEYLVIIKFKLVRGGTRKLCDKKERKNVK